MKHVALAIYLLIVILNVMAQDPNYSGPAKGTVKAFWDGVAKLEKSIAAGGSNLDRDVLVNLGRKIQDIKTKDVSYNTAAMEEKFKALAEGIVSLKTNKDKEKQQAEDFAASREVMEKKVNDLLTYLFDGNKDDHIPVEMKAKTTEMLTLDRSGNKTMLNVWLGRLKKNAEEAQVRYPKLEKICKEQTKLIEAQNYYRHFQSYQAYWDAAQKIFPEEISFGNTYSLITNILIGLGSENNLLALVAKNYEQRVKDTRLPVAKVKDAALEKLFMDAYDKMYGESHKGKAIRAIIVSDDWQIQRNEVTGIVTGRLRKGAIVYKNAEGQCRLVEEFFIQQEYVGNSFIGTKSVYAVGKGQEMLCEYVK
jgi:hypothetical protein